jgi:hypothetical protein
MSQSDRQDPGAVPVTPRGRRGGELFWRIVAGLMLLMLAWIAWVMYQITPRSVVTPLAYASAAKSASAPASAPGATAPAPDEGAAARSHPSADAAALAMEQAQAAMRAGAHQASADVQAAAAARKNERVSEGGLRLATEISMPPTEDKRMPKTQGGEAGGVNPRPAAADAAGKARP